MLTTTEGIVLRQVKAASGRRILLIFTREYGKISVGTGLTERNNRSKAALAIRPFTYARYDLYKNKDYFDLNSADVLKSYYGLGEDIDKYVAASYLLELTDKALPEEMPQPKLFSILTDVLAELEQRKSGFDTILICYEVKLLAEVGLLPVLDRCARCGAPEPALFSVPDGGMICRDCAKKIEAKTVGTGKGRLILEPGFDIVKVIDYFLKKPVSAFRKVALEQSTASQLQAALREYLSYHMDIGSLKSESML